MKVLATALAGALFAVDAAYAAWVVVRSAKSRDCLDKMM